VCIKIQDRNNSSWGLQGINKILNFSGQSVSRVVSIESAINLEPSTQLNHITCRQI